MIMDGAVPSWLFSSVCTSLFQHMAPNTGVWIHAPTSKPNKIEIIPRRPETNMNKLDKILNYTIKNTPKFTFLDIYIPSYTISDVPKAVKKINPPALPRNKPIVISGRLPSAIYCQLVSSYYFAGHSVAMYAPTLGEDKHVAVVCTPDDYGKIIKIPSGILTLSNPLEPIKNTIIAICGPSGSGKTTVAKHLLERIHGSELILSYTTRERRPDELDGFDKHFVTKESFEEMIEAGLFSTPDGKPLYQRQKSGHYYGRRYDELTATQFPIVDVSFPGLRMLRKAFGRDVFSVFIKTRLSEKRRFELMMQRGEMTEKEARERVIAGEQMMKDHAKMNFDAVVENRFGKIRQTGGIIRHKFMDSIDKGVQYS